MTTTDTPLSDEDAISALLQPIETEEEVEAVEAPQNETDTEETEIEADASEAEDEEIGEDDELSEVETDDTSDDDEDETNDDEQSEQLYTVKSDGEELQVTLEEALRGFSGQRKIQKDMEANALRAKELEQHVQTLQQQSQATLELYNQLNETGVLPEPQKPPRSMLETDPFGYYDLKDKWEDDMVEYKAQQKKIELLQEQDAKQKEAMATQQYQQRVSAAEQALLQDMPELSDPEKAKAFRKTLVSAAEAYGFTQNELKEVIADPRSVKALRDAQKWRALQANKKAGKQPKETPKSATRPKGKPRDTGKVSFQKGLQKAKRTQNPDDFVDLILQPDS